MTDRRSFLQTGLALASASVALPETAAPKITSSVMLWTLKGSFEERLEIAGKAGLQSVELVAEHVGWDDARIREMKQRARSFHLGMDTLIATPDWGKRPVSMVDAAQRPNFLKDVQQSIAYAQKLEIPQIILMAGNAIPGRTYQEQWASLVESCRRAGDLAAKANLTLIVEPLNNKVNHKGYFLPTCVEGLALIQEVDHPNVRLLFDIYHEQVQIGNVIRTMREAKPYVKVFHIADNPGRNDPGTGELDYGNIYKAIRDMGYSGYVTMEYLPLADPVASLTRSVSQMRQVLPA